jgi:tetratricopeptide (TPR) repeat protein
VRKVQAIWDRVCDPAARADLLDAVLESVVEVDPRAAPLRDAVVKQADHADAAAWLGDPQTASFEREAVSLWVGRELVRQDRFDEALPFLARLDVDAAVDPAALLFHRAACQHWLLDAEGAIDSLDRLLEREGQIPTRYERVARLLRADAAALEAESLDHIARRMRDVTRRLDLGKAGPGTRTVQDGVIESLDKLIKKLEDQQQQQQQGGGGAGGASGQGGEGRPMDDSRIAGGKGAGDVQKRDIGGQDGWGNLPPHQREEALQQIGREFPPHYREAIEQYFKRLAAGGEDR